MYTYIYYVYIWVVDVFCHHGSEESPVSEILELLCHDIKAFFLLPHRLQRGLSNFLFVMSLMTASLASWNLCRAQPLPPIFFLPA